MSKQSTPPRTVEQLRADIDSGLTGEKVAGSDPAAAPMGTDAEAGGASPTQAEIELEHRSRVVPAPGGRPGEANDAE